MDPCAHISYLRGIFPYYYSKIRFNKIAPQPNVQQQEDPTVFFITQIPFFFYDVFFETDATTDYLTYASIHVFKEHGLQLPACCSGRTSM